MKKALYLCIGIVFLLSVNVFAQDYDEDYDEYGYEEDYEDDLPEELSFEDGDDMPYLDDDDIAAIEMVLPEDTPEMVEKPREIAEEKPAGANEMPRLNTSRTLYHLLILDRRNCPNSDIADLKNINVLYKFKHGRNGYLIAIYTSSKEGPVFPVLPAGSRILVELVTSHKIVLRDYVNSTAFRRFVTHRRVLSEIRRIL